jgi:hypothetical protein
MPSCSPAFHSPGRPMKSRPGATSFQNVPVLWTDRSRSKSIWPAATPLSEDDGGTTDSPLRTTRLASPKAAAVFPGARAARTDSNERPAARGHRHAPADHFDDFVVVRHAVQDRSSRRLGDLVESSGREDETPRDRRSPLSAANVQPPLVQSAARRSRHRLGRPAASEDPIHHLGEVGPGGEDRRAFDDVSTRRMRPSQTGHQLADRVVLHAGSLRPSPIRRVRDRYIPAGDAL